MRYPLVFWEFVCCRAAIGCHGVSLFTFWADGLPCYACALHRTGFSVLLGIACDSEVGNRADSPFFYVFGLQLAGLQLAGL